MEKSVLCTFLFIINNCCGFKGRKSEESDKSLLFSQRRCFNIKWRNRNATSADESAKLCADRSGFGLEYSSLCVTAAEVKQSLELYLFKIYFRLVFVCHFLVEAF